MTADLDQLRIDNMAVLDELLRGGHETGAADAAMECLREYPDWDWHVRQVFRECLDDGVQFSRGFGQRLEAAIEPHVALIMSFSDEERARINEANRWESDEPARSSLEARLDDLAERMDRLTAIVEQVAA